MLSAHHALKLSAAFLVLGAICAGLPATADAGFIMLQNGPRQTGPGHEGWVLHPDNTRQWVDARCRDSLENLGIPVRVVKYRVIGGYPETRNWMLCEDLRNAVRRRDGGSSSGSSSGGSNSGLVMMQNGPRQTNPGHEGWVLHTDNTRQWVSARCRESLQSAGIPLRVVNYSVIGRYPTTGNWQPCERLLATVRGDSSSSGSSSSGSSSSGSSSSGSSSSGSSSSGSSSSGSNSSGSNSSSSNSSSSSGGNSSGSSGTVARLNVTLANVPDAPDFKSGSHQSSNALIVNDPRGTSNNRRDLEGAFRMTCKVAEDNYSDPVVKWGMHNGAHHHLFFGNARITPYSTNDPSVTSTQNIQRQPLYKFVCHGGRANQSGYWAPVVYDQNGKPRMPKGQLKVYYKTAPGQNGSSVQAPPQGLQIVAGNPGAKAPKSNWAVRIGCGGSGNNPTIQPTRFQRCNTHNQTVEMFMRFPNCWDGNHLTDVDHDGDPNNDDADAPDDPHSHMRYSIPSRRHACPASHPIPIPSVSYHFEYPLYPGDDSSRWYLSSDVSHGSSRPDRPGGSSWHADWMNGWEPKLLQEWMNGCIRPNLHCANGDMGQRRLVNPPAEPGAGSISDYDASKDARFRYSSPSRPHQMNWSASLNACGSSGSGDVRHSFGATLSCKTKDGNNRSVTLNHSQLLRYGLTENSCGTHKIDLKQLSEDSGYSTINGKTPCSIESFSVSVTDSNGNRDSTTWRR